MCRLFEHNVPHPFSGSLIERYEGYLKIYRPIFQVAFPLYNAAFVYCLAILPCPTYSPPPRFLFPS